MTDSTRDPDQGAAAGTARSPGARLAAAREDRGMSVNAAAESMGVPSYVLEALESDAWERLEAPVYVRGYLRKYARLLGLPEDDVVADYEAQAAPTDPEVRAHASGALPRGANARLLGPLVGLIVVAVLVLAGIWTWHRLHRKVTPASVPAAAVSAMMAATRSAPAGASVGPSIAATAKGTAAAGHAPATDTPSPGMHLVLSLSAPSWVEVYGPGHKRLYYNLAAAGDSLKFNPSHGPVTVFLGNAPAATLTLNGKPYPIPPSKGGDNTARFTIRLPQQAPAKGTAP